MDLKALLTLNNADKLFANPKRIALLKQIRITGSISQGAKQAGISYKAAWDAVNDMNLQAPQPVVSSEKGGKGGGGAKLTEFGERLLKLYELMDQMQDMVLKALLDAAVPMDNLLDLMAHFSLKTSARNQLAGEVIALKDDSLNDNVRVKLAGGQEIDAAITHASTDKLGLHIGKKVLLLFKAPAVSIHSLQQPLSSGNRLKGQLLQIKRDPQRSEITLDIGGNDRLYASVCNDSIEGLPLTLGDHLQASFEPGQTLIACLK
ncbi:MULTISPECIES: TOBE domain-containing protein [Shewanella]|uniref:TOBE domain-containing protein n=1 Tax=Shewanella TaxID=22 RepID=UPI000579E7FB|nr:TOBE domain-containing protein [Shewanella sp. ECSMB14102]OIN16971.1 molybdenum-dependent transcriptional regulator [Shewanella algae]